MRKLEVRGSRVPRAQVSRARWRVGFSVVVPTIIVTGPVGVGKTTVAHEMGMLLVGANVPHATVDFDQLTACYPRPADDDRWGTQLGLQNLAALWRNYERSGARRLLIARVIEARSDLDGYREAVPGADIFVVRLRATPQTLQSRVRKRGPGREMEWHLRRAVELAPLMDAQAVEDLLIETDSRDAIDIARDILVKVGWLGSG